MPFERAYGSLAGCRARNIVRKSAPVVARERRFSGQAVIPQTTPVWLATTLRILVPALAAGAAVLFDSRFGEFFRSRPGLLPVAMFALMGALLIARWRRWLIVCLCFGVAWMALRDVLGPVRLPPGLDTVRADQIYPFAMGLLATLAACAACAEAVRPESVIARRAYFAAAAVYLTTHGVLGLMLGRHWGSWVLLACGACAMVGVFAAHRIVAREEAGPQEDADLAAMRLHMEQRAAVLRQREWKEKPESFSQIP